MVSTRSSKRSRSEDCNSQDDTAVRPVLDFTTSSRFWFEDGNIVIVVEAMGYRIHGSLLARHSAVFEDMLKFSQSNENDFVYEDLPVIVLYDTSEDFEHILSVFYDNIKDYDRDAPVAFPLVAAMLRLGQKYEIDHLLRESMKHLGVVYPTKLNDWKPLSNRIVIEDQTILKAINLAHELSLQKPLPSMYLSFIRRYGQTGLLSPDNISLNPIAKREMLRGREKLILYMHKQHRTLKRKILGGTNNMFEGCTTPVKCQKSREDAFDSLPLWTTDGGKVTNLKRWAKLSQPLCSGCTQVLQTMYDETREAAWKELPQFFELPRWDELKDDIFVQV